MSSEKVPDEKSTKEKDVPEVREASRPAGVDPGFKDLNRRDKDESKQLGKDLHSAIFSVDEKKKRTSTKKKVPTSSYHPSPEYFHRDKEFPDLHSSIVKKPADYPQAPTTVVIPVLPISSSDIVSLAESSSLNPFANTFIPRMILPPVQPIVTPVLHPGTSRPPRLSFSQIALASAHEPPSLFRQQIDVAMQQQQQQQQPEVPDISQLMHATAEFVQNLKWNIKLPVKEAEELPRYIPGGSLLFRARHIFQPQDFPMWREMSVVDYNWRLISQLKSVGDIKEYSNADRVCFSVLITDWMAFYNDLLDGINYLRRPGCNVCDHLRWSRNSYRVVNMNRCEDDTYLWKNRDNQFLPFALDGSFYILVKFDKGQVVHLEARSKTIDFFYKPSGCKCQIYGKQSEETRPDNEGGKGSTN